MAPLPADPSSAPIHSNKRKITSHHTHTTSHGSKLSKTAIIVIIAIIAVLIIALVAFAFFQKRRKSRGGNNKRNSKGDGLVSDSSLPGYSADASGGLYGGSDMGPPGYRGVETGDHGIYDGGEAAGYYAQSYGRHGQVSQAGYGRVNSYDMPQRPPTAFNSSRA